MFWLTRRRCLSPVPERWWMMRELCSSLHSQGLSAAEPHLYILHSSHYPGNPIWRAWGNQTSHANQHLQVTKQDLISPQALFLPWGIQVEGMERYDWLPQIRTGWEVSGGACVVETGGLPQGPASPSARRDWSWPHSPRLQSRASGEDSGHIWQDDEMMALFPWSWAGFPGSLNLQVILPLLAPVGILYQLMSVSGLIIIKQEKLRNYEFIDTSVLILMACVFNGLFIIQWFIF